MDTHAHEISRRGFLATSLTGLAAAGMAGLSPAVALAQAPAQSDAEAGNEIIYREFGKTGIRQPVVSMGVGSCNDPGLIQASYEAGIRHFDTAANYQFGRNEQLVGQVVKRLGVRDKVVISTKVWTPPQRTSESPDQAKKRFVALVEGSLRRLKTDYVDVCCVHDVNSAASSNDVGAMEALAQLKKAGKVRAAGVATHQRMAEVIAEVARLGAYDVVVTSFNVTMADDTVLGDAIRGASAKGIGFVAMKTQAGGVQLPNQASLQQYPTSVQHKAMLKWVLRHPEITTAIPGYATLEHLQQDFSVASNLEYSEDEYKFLADNNLKLGLGFCRQCTRCLATCPKGVDVPALMRTHMYAAQYRDFYLARTTLDSIPWERSIHACASCTECKASCANLVDVNYRINDLKLMYA